MQWEEELKLLKREMVMAARDFQTRQEVWKFKSRSFSRAPGMKEYAAQKSNFFAKLGADLTKRCDACVTVRIVSPVYTIHWDIASKNIAKTALFKDPIVTLRWATEHWPVDYDNDEDGDSDVDFNDVSIWTFLFGDIVF